jgi:DNA-binding GntR family transcriptional regulator
VRGDPSTSLIADEIARDLRVRITAGALPPGAPLRDAALAVEFDASRNTVREAVRILRHEGLVEHHLHRGVVVCTLTPAAVRDIYVARRALELRAAEESGLASEEALAALGAAVRRAEQAVREHAWDEVGTASLTFHQALVALLGSPSLDGFFATVVARLRLAFAVMADERAFQTPWVARDRHIWELLDRGQRTAGQRELRSYLDDSERAVLDVIRAHRPPHRRRTPDPDPPMEALTTHDIP